LVFGGLAEVGGLAVAEGRNSPIWGSKQLEKSDCRYFEEDIDEKSIAGISASRRRRYKLRLFHDRKGANLPSRPVRMIVPFAAGGLLTFHG